MRLVVVRSTLLLVVAVAAVALGASACGRSGSPRVATVTTTSARGSGRSTSGSSTAGAERAGSTGAGDIQSALLAFAKCMRSNGVPDFPDPTGGGFQVGAGTDRSSPALKGAQAKCQKLLPGGGLGPGSGPPPSAYALAQMLTVSQCMRRHGISEFPDPRTSVPPDPFGGGTGVISDINGVILVFPGTIDQQSPAFTRAAALCAFPLHNH